MSTTTIFSQEDKIVYNRDGLKISYQLILEAEGKKKDKYILLVNALNENNYDLYYDVPLYKNNQGQWNLPLTPQERGFTKIDIRNSTGLFGNGQSIIGDQSNFFTNNHTILFNIRQGGVYTQETTFKVKSGVKPIITNSINSVLKKIDEFDLMLSAEMLNGNYVSSCGNIRINISASNSEARGDFLIQTTNGSQFFWIKKSETTFVRENNSGLTLTYNKSDNSFTYSSSDGIVCDWIKK
ncbi:hypothetical protein [uncultured Dokdonia sp.]|uniref:hypothetical protein n=1 Tax=uncultured Dokdonia sp. TaxID=575653 RepID=UPI0026107223|nr:hypothetical protein [uncultured Dokdonia sp.]